MLGSCRSEVDATTLTVLRCVCSKPELHGGEPLDASPSCLPPDWHHLCMFSGCASCIAQAPLELCMLPYVYRMPPRQAQRSAMWCYECLIATKDFKRLDVCGALMTGSPDGAEAGTSHIPRCPTCLYPIESTNRRASKQKSHSHCDRHEQQVFTWS